MTPVRIALALVVMLGALVVGFLEVDTNVQRLLGDNDRVTAALDTPEGRSLTLAIIDPDADKRSLLASRIASDLRNNPLVHRVISAPGAQTSASSPEMLDWIWEHRFELAPPAPEAFFPDSLITEMRRARAALISTSDSAFADQFLRDPTGSFRRILAALKVAPKLAGSTYRGVAQARDNTAALIFFEMSGQPFDVAAQTAFDADLKQRVRADGAEALLIGPRAISARISTQIATRTTLAAVAASVLMLLWLVWILRPVSMLLVCLVPLALGVGAAILIVQVGFGSVHVIALGFGGALLGLALDYPLHLLAHRGGLDARVRARRYVMIGAATTAIAFLALLGSGISAIGQVGLFVAAGLIVAAVCSVWLVGAQRSAVLKSFTLVRRPLVVPYKLPGLAALALAGAVFLWQSPAPTTQHLVEVPSQIIGEVKRLSAMIDLPSGRYRIDVTGATLAQVLAHQARLAGVLQAAERDGWIARSEMLGSYLPTPPVSPNLPSPEALSDKLPGLMAAAGLDPDFMDQIIANYQVARATPPTGPNALGLLEGLAPGLIQADGDSLRTSVRLWDVAAPPKLAKAVSDIGQADITFIDQETAITAGLTALSSQVALWLALGVTAGLVFLCLSVRRPTAVAEIAVGCLAAGLVTAVLVSFATGSLGVFHIVALTLVIGIGIDYGIFLTLSETDEQYRAAMRSVNLCAATTLIAFLTMAFSEVGVLEDIGMTVSIGVIAMVGVNLVRRRIAWPLDAWSSEE